MHTGRPTTRRTRHSALELKDRSLVLGSSRLMYACQQGDVQRVLQILKEQPISVYKQDRSLKTALHYCPALPGAQPSFTSVGVAGRLCMAAPELLESPDSDGLTPLHLAAIQGDTPLVALLLAEGAEVNALDNEKHSVVHWATVCGELEILRLLLSHKADPCTADIHGGHPLHYAAQLCGAPLGSGELPDNEPIGVKSNEVKKLSLEVLKELLVHVKGESGTSRSSARGVHAADLQGRTPLLWAASAGSSAAVMALVKAGARVESSDRDGLTALHCAASRGRTQCIETLLSLCGATTDIIDSNGCTALHYAVTLGHADATSLLLDHGAEPSRQDRRGRTPAHCACAKGQLETVKLLGARGGNLWMRNARGDLPLHDAVGCGRRELVTWLLSLRPAAVNASGHDGKTPLHLAAAMDHADICKILLDQGAHVNPLHRTPRSTLVTPLDCALHRGHRTTAKYLQAHGGVPAVKLGAPVAVEENVTTTIQVPLAQTPIPRPRLKENPPGSSKIPVTLSRNGARSGGKYDIAERVSSTVKDNDTIGVRSGAIDNAANSVRVVVKGDSTINGKSGKEKDVTTSVRSGNNNDVAIGVTDEVTHDTTPNVRHGTIDVDELNLGDPTLMSNKKRSTSRLQDYCSSSSENAVGKGREDICNCIHRCHHGKKMESLDKYKRTKSKKREKLQRRSSYEDESELEHKKTSKSKNIERKMKMRSNIDDGSDDGLRKRDKRSKSQQSDRRVHESTKRKSKNKQNGKEYIDDSHRRRSQSEIGGKIKDKYSKRNKILYDSSSSESSSSSMSEIDEKRSKKRSKISEKSGKNKRKIVKIEKTKSYQKLQSSDESSESESEEITKKSKKSTSYRRNYTSESSEEESTVNHKVDGQKKRDTKYIKSSEDSGTEKSTTIKKKKKKRQDEDEKEISEKEDTKIEKTVKTKKSTADKSKKKSSMKKVDIEVSEESEYENGRKTLKVKNNQKSTKADKTKSNLVRKSASSRPSSAKITKKSQKVIEKEQVVEKLVETELGKQEKTESKRIESVQHKNIHTTSSENENEESTKSGRKITTEVEVHSTPDNTIEDNTIEDNTIEDMKIETGLQSNEHLTETKESTATKEDQTINESSEKADTTNALEDAKQHDDNKSVEEHTEKKSVTKTEQGEDMDLKKETIAVKEELLEAESEKMLRESVREKEASENQISVKGEENIHDEETRIAQEGTTAEKLDDELSGSLQENEEKSSENITQNEVEVHKMEDHEKTEGIEIKEESAQEREEIIREIIKQKSKEEDKEKASSDVSIETTSEQINVNATEHKTPSEITEHETKLQNGSVAAPQNKNISSDSETTDSSSDTETENFVKNNNNKNETKISSIKNGDTAEETKKIISSQNETEENPTHEDKKKSDDSRSSEMENVRNNIIKSASNFSPNSVRRKRLKKRTRTKSRMSADVDMDGYESSTMMDSGFEPSPRVINKSRTNLHKMALSGDKMAAAGGDWRRRRAADRKPGDDGAVNMTTVNQSMQANIRRYYTERIIFQQLLELKRLQIRSSRTNEAVLVKRAIDQYHRSGHQLARYTDKDYSYESFEKFLYETLKKLQRIGSSNYKLIAENMINLDKLNSNALFCTTKTHRCNHATHAYTGIPCAAYIPMMNNHHTMPKLGFRKVTPPEGFLPRIKTGNKPRSANNAVSLELSHGNDHQVISLPSDKLDVNKKYYVTFTVRGSNPGSEGEGGKKTSKQLQKI